MPEVMETDALKKMVIGGTAAVISKTTTAPLDRVKLVLQVQNGQLSLEKYSGMKDCLKQLTSNEGILSLWRGNSASVMRCFPNHALHFFFRDIYRGIFLHGINRKEKSKYFLGSVASGGMGGATALTVLYPFDYVRTKMAVERKAKTGVRFRGIYDCLNRTRQASGISVWYRGFSSSLQFVFFSRAVFFGLFDTIRTELVEDQRDMSFITTLAIAQTCLIISGFSCYPLDTIRRRMMVDSTKTRRQFPTTMSCWSHILKTEGFQSLYRGVVPNTIRSSSGALIISLYYEISKYL